MCRLDTPPRALLGDACESPAGLVWLGWDVPRWPPVAGMAEGCRVHMPRYFGGKLFFPGRLWCRTRVVPLTPGGFRADCWHTRTMKLGLCVLQAEAHGP